MHVWELYHTWNLEQIAGKNLAQSPAFSCGSWHVLKGSCLFYARPLKPICRIYKHGTFLNTVFDWTISVTCFLLYCFFLLPLAQFNWFLPFSLKPTSPLPLPSKTSKQTNQPQHFESSLALQGTYLAEKDTRQAAEKQPSQWIVD